MHRRTLLFLFCFLAVVVGISAAQSTNSYSTQLQVFQSGNASLVSVPAGDNNSAGLPEQDPAMAGDDDESDTPLSGGKIINRSIATNVGTGSTVRGNARAKSNPELALSFQGL